MMARTKQRSLKRRPTQPRKRIACKAARKSAPVGGFGRHLSYYTVRLSYQQGKMLGRGLWLFGDCKKKERGDECNNSAMQDNGDDRRLRLSSRSPIFVYAKQLLRYAESSNEEALEAARKQWQQQQDQKAKTAPQQKKRQKIGEHAEFPEPPKMHLDTLIEWGRNNLAPLQYESSSVSLEEISNEHLRLALSGAIAPYDAMERIRSPKSSQSNDAKLGKNQNEDNGRSNFLPHYLADHYTSNSTHDIEEGDLHKILSLPESYPLFITFRREDHLHDYSSIQGLDPNVLPLEMDVTNADSILSTFDIDAAHSILSIMGRDAWKDPTKRKFTEGEFVLTPFGPGRVISSRVDRYPLVNSGAKFDDGSKTSDTDSDGWGSGYFCGSKMSDRSEGMNMADGTVYEPLVMYCIDLNFGTCCIPAREIRPVIRNASWREEVTPYSNFNEYADHLKRGCWKKDMLAILGDTDQKGVFCEGKEVTDDMPYLSPLIHVNGMEEPLAFPLLKSQAKELQSISKNNSVLANEMHIQDHERWQTVVQRIAKDFASMMGVGFEQQQHVKARLCRMVLFQPGQGAVELPKTNEMGSFGSLIIQLPSHHTGGSINIAFGEEQREFDFSELASGLGVFAAAYYSDCKCNLSQVREGWKLCLEYNLLLSPSPPSNIVYTTLPSGSALVRRMQRLQSLASSWDGNFNHPLCYLLEDDYKGKSLEGDNLKFENLEGSDKGVVDLLQECRDVDGDKTFSVGLMLLQQDEEQDEYCIGGGNRIVLEVDVGEVDLDFDIDKHLLVSGAQQSLQNLVFGKHRPLVHVWFEEGRHGVDSRREESYRFRAVVLFWPRARRVNLFGRADKK